MYVSDYSKLIIISIESFIVLSFSWLVRNEFKTEKGYFWYINLKKNFAKMRGIRSKFLWRGGGRSGGWGGGNSERCLKWCGGGHYLSKTAQNEG